MPTHNQNQDGRRGSDPEPWRPVKSPFVALMMMMMAVAVMMMTEVITSQLSNIDEIIVLL